MRMPTFRDYANAKFSAGRAARRGVRRASTLLMTLVYMIMFASLATSMVAFSQANMTVQDAENDADKALIAAESGMSFLMLQFKTVGMPAIKEGSITSMSSPAPSALWSGSNVESLSFPGTSNPNNNGIAVQLAAALNSSQALSTTVTAPSGTNTLNVPAIKVDSGNSKATYTLSVAWDTSAANPRSVQVAIPNTNPQQYTNYPGVLVLNCMSTGTSGTTQRSVSMSVWIQKTLKYAVYSNVAIQLGKNVRVVGDIASTYTGTGKGPPVQMFSDFHYLPNMSQMDNDLANLRGLLNTYDTTFTNRISTSNKTAVTAAASQGISDLNGDGFIDDMDVALKNLDSNHDAQISSGEFVNPNTGKSYDADLFAVIDDPEGAVSGGTLPNGSLPLWYGYGDGTINNLDGYAKVDGTVKMALSYASWQSAASGWSDWGDTSGGTSGTNFRDQFEGPVVNSDPTQAPVQFGVDFSSQQTLQPTNFDTSSYDSLIPGSNATKSGSNISNGTLTTAMANGGTVTEHSPASATSGWQATYSRPVFQNINFTNVRIPKGLNAKFINCTFNGYTSVQMNTTIVTGGTVKSTGAITGGTTQTDPNSGMNYAQRMITGSFSADTTLTATNSVAFTQGNNLHFSGCSFNGPIAAAIPTAYTHFADSLEFDGVTNFNNTADPTFTILAPQSNIEMGSFQNPGGNPSTLTGVVVAGNIDIRGSATVDGSIVVTGAGATNTTLGYFGSTDQGQAVPPPSQLPTEANGAYGHLYFKINPSRGMPNGIAIPVLATPQYQTYQVTN